MPTTNLEPNADISTQSWIQFPASGSHYDKVDETIAGQDGDTTYVNTTVINDSDRWGFTDTPANTSEVTSIDVSVRAYITDVSATAKIRLELFHSGSTAVSGNPKDVTGTDLGGYGSSYGTATKTWGGLNLTKAQADSLEVKVTFLGS